MNDIKETLNSSQRECYQMLVDLVGGEHHITGNVRLCSDSGIAVSLIASGWATFDGDMLTRIVVMAHERCIRAEVNSSSPGRIGLALHKRNGRQGAFYDKHPILSDHVVKLMKEKRI